MQLVVKAKPFYIRAAFPQPDTIAPYIYRNPGNSFYYRDLLQPLTRHPGMSIIALKVVDMSLMNLYSTKGLSNQLIQAIENLQYHLRGILDAPEQFAEFSYELDQCTVLLRLFKEQASNGPNITRNYQTEIYLRNVLTDIEEVQELVEELENAARMRRTGLMAPPLAMPTSSELPKLHKRIRILATNMVLWLHVVNL